MVEYWVSTKKYFCHICQISLADNKASRMRHEQSQLHKENQRNLLKNGGRRERRLPIQEFQNSPTQEYATIEQAAFKKHKREDGLRFHMDPRSYYSQEQVTQFEVEEPKIEETIWSAHFDEEGNVYYYNRMNQYSTWIKPPEFDGYDPIADQQNNEYLNTFQDFKPTPITRAEDKGLAGKWEVVHQKKDYYQANKLSKEEQEQIEEKKKQRSEKSKEILLTHNNVELLPSKRKDKFHFDKWFDESDSDQSPTSNQKKGKDSKTFKTDDDALQVQDEVEFLKSQVRHQSFNRVQKNPVIEDNQWDKLKKCGTTIKKRVNKKKRKRPEEEKSKEDN